jgi:type IV pilus secretin PilQ/predicted competence protein
MCSTLVLQLRDLDKRVQDNVIIVGPPKLANRERAALAARKDIQDLAPLRTEYLQINYAKAEDIAALIQSQSGGGKTLLSSRGSVSIDNRTNTLLIQDTADSIANVRQLVSTLDIPVRQVRIEARIVVVSEDFSRDLGVRLGFTGTESNGANGLISTTGSAAGVDNMLSSALDNLQSTGSPYPVSVPTGPGAVALGSAASRYNVNLPAPSPAGSLAWAILGSDYIVDLELSAAQSEGRGEVISQPSIITANQKEAVISQNLEIRIRKRRRAAPHHHFQARPARAEGDPADHARQSPDPRHQREEGSRRSGGRHRRRRERAGHRHQPAHHHRVHRRRPDGCAGRHPRDRAARKRKESAVPGGHPGAWTPVQVHRSREQQG